MLDIVPVERAIVGKMRQQACEQRGVGAGLQTQKQIGIPGGIGAARIDRDNARATLLLVGEHALEQDRMAPRRIGADQHQQIGLVEILIAAGHGVGAECAAMARDRGGHAQPRIGIDIGAADESLHQLVGDVVILGQQLPGEIERHRARAVARDDVLEAVRDVIERVGPGHPLHIALAAADHRIKQAILKAQRFAERRAFRAEPSEIGGMLGIARDRGTAAAIRRREHAAADAAIRTGRAGGAQSGVDGRHLNRPVMASRRFRRQCERPAEHHVGANSHDRLLAADHIEIPERVRGIADQHRPGEPAIGNHQLLVGAAPDVAQHDGFAAVRADEIAGGKHRHAGHLQVGRNDAAVIGRGTASQMTGQHTRLIVGGFDQAVADATMFGAFAEREDIRCRGLQMVVDHDAAIDGYAGVFRQRGVRPDSGCENHRLGIEHATIGKFDAFDMRFAKEPRGVSTQQHCNALALDQGFQQFRRRRIELALHQAVHQMDQRYRRSRFGKTVGGFKSEQSAADDNHALLGASQRQQKVDVAAVTKGVHAGEIRAGHIEPQRRRAGGKDQPGKRNAFFVGDLEFAAADIDLGGEAAIFQGDAAVAPPVGRLELDVVGRGLARQHRGQQHAVIGQPRLGPDHGDGVSSKRHLRQFVDQTRGGHSIADNNQRFAHETILIRQPWGGHRLRKS